MKRYYRLVQRISFSVIIIALLPFLLSGCSHRHNKVDTHPSVSAQRNAWIQLIKGNGGDVYRLGETVWIIMPSDQLFRPASANILDCYKSSLLAAAKLIGSYATVSVKVSAYTDVVRKRRGNIRQDLLLTHQQAQAVADYLWQHGINTRILLAQGYGPTHAVSPNYTGMGRSLNRRVEIQFRFYRENDGQY